MARDDVFDKIVIGAGPVGESVARPAVEGGPHRARYFALTQPQLGAHDDERLRLVNEVVAKDKVHSPTLELDEQLATRPAPVPRRHDHGSSSAPPDLAQ